MRGPLFDLLARCFLKSPMATKASTTTGTSSSSSTSTKTTGPDIITNLTNLLPTGTFLTFQAIAPLFSNNGDCGLVEKVLTGILIFTFSIIVVVLTFTDSVTTTSGKNYYGLVTCKGLWNPQFKESSFTNGTSFYNGDTKRYTASIFDGVNAVLSVVVFATLVLTPPVSTCYYPNVPSTVVKAVPVLVGIVAGLYFSFAPPPRRGVGYSVAGLVIENPDDTGPKVNDGTTATKPTAADAKPDTVQLEEGADPAKQTLEQKATQSTTTSPGNFSSAV